MRARSNWAWRKGESIFAWLRAARVPAQSNIAPSLILGQVLAYGQTGFFSWPVFYWVTAFGVFDHLTIVFANDVADAETDRLNQTATPFSGGSRVLADGILSRRSLACAAVLMASLTLIVSFVLALGFHRTFCPLFAIAALILLWAYSYPPLKLSYRGGGEWLQVMGIGVVLPLLGFYAQRGHIGDFPFALWGATLPLQYAGAIATALPDTPSDRASAKRTASVLWGVRRAECVAFLLQAAGVMIYCFLADSKFPPTWFSVVLPSALIGLQLLLPRATPGRRTMLWRVFLILSTNFAFTLGLILVVLGVHR